MVPIGQENNLVAIFVECLYILSFGTKSLLTKKNNRKEKSIKPFQCPTSRAWDVPMNAVIEEIEKIQCQKIAKKIKRKI